MTLWLALGDERHNQYHKMKVSIEATAFVILLTLSRIRSDRDFNCSEVGKCATQKECCGSVCVAVSNCNKECANDMDCNRLRSARCVAGYCECSLGYFCHNESAIWDENRGLKLCEIDLDCTRLNARCRNETCKSKVVNPLNPALLAIVTIIGVLMFSCLFCCCLSKMKSERRSMKSREVKGKLKSLGIEPSRVATENSSPLLKGKSQNTTLQDISEYSEEAKSNVVSRQRNQHMLLSVVVEAGLPPICEEDEAEEHNEEK